ncbi:MULTISPECIES: ribonuclease Y [unclassified Gemella]|uniref:ribonuclease Y n=1 Tax=unclassified Gemella TaxID=2624949 RepID=UPI001074052E|nr:MULTISPECIES: ribonuclease Y [unclassified Gemella]MBF0710235.1 ribonuclease Y [Gemella sp. GL1.1]MBF0746535.1 ribonuclease Y [Gemella sp. 19428wG2_WT2a]NYS27579.1 ribonuclease Y [Gemella sp. GL1]TFU60313.1 ribonuclease Y [Gemella sp. WT2a]
MFVGSIIATLLVGLLFGYFVAKNLIQSKLIQSKQDANHIINEAKKEAKFISEKEVLLAKKEASEIINLANKEIEFKKQDIIKQEERLIQKESTLERQSELISKKDELISSREFKVDEKLQLLEEKNSEVNELKIQQENELQRIANLTEEQAREEIMSSLEEEMTKETTIYIRNREIEAKDIADRRARELIVQSMQKFSADVVSETTVSVINLPTDDMKGRIIGREGRNIRTLETLTGVDLIIDDTPEAVLLSGYDPIRREVAKTAIHMLIEDGRIHPAKIEETVEKARRNIDQVIRDAGEQATFDLGIHNMHPDLIKILGKMKYRTSYGQNGLQHSIEVAYISGIIAGELGLDVTIARRAGLLHDIGKAVDHEVEGSHVEVGVELAKKYKENSIVINAIASHHGDYEADNPISVIVATADALSASRPGARRESLETYIKRLQKLEEIANEHKGVEKTYAIQAGREIRVIVNPEEIDDTRAYKIAKEVRNKIEETMQYPGNIKVNVIREVRAVKIAK